MTQEQNTSIASSQVGTEKNDGTVYLLPLFKILWNKRWLISFFTLTAVVLAWLYASQQDPVYRATVSVQIDRKESNVVSIKELYGMDLMSDYMNTQFELIKSRAVAERVVQELDLVNHPDFNSSESASLFNWRAFALDWLVANEEEQRESSEGGDSFVNQLRAVKDQLLLKIASPPPELTATEKFEITVLKFMERVTVTPVKQSQIVKISVDMNDPHTAALAANTVAENYINSQLEAAIAEVTQVTVWMNGRLVELKKNLAQSEELLQNFKQQRGLLDVRDGITSMQTDELTELNTQLAFAKAARAKAESEYIQVRGVKAKDWQSLASIPAVMNSPLVKSFISEEAKAQSNVESLSKTYGYRHPETKKAESELKTAKENLRQQVEQVIAGIKKNYQAALGNERTLQKAIMVNKEQVSEVAGNEFRLNELKREVESNQALYDEFLTRIKEASATSEMQTNIHARIIDEAMAPLRPIKPKKKLIMVMAGVLALMVIVGLVLLLRSLDNTFKSTRQVESKLNLPVLGVLPMVKRNRRGLFKLYNKKSHLDYNESIDSVRTGVLLSSLKHNYKKIVVTSSIPGEGKTTTATNLAYAINQTEKTLLIEADMRRANIGRHLGISVGSPGLANVLAGNALLEEVIYEVDGLDVIPAGTVPPNPLELISDYQFRDMLEVLSEEYERIIIDSPPVNAVSDPVLLSSYVDRVVYVIKTASTPVEAVQKGVGVLLQHNAPLQGVILNQSDIKKLKKEGVSYEGHYDYYGYGK